MAWEVAALTGWRQPPLVEVDGPGPVAACSAARRAVARGADLLVSWGSAGALCGARPGEIVLPDAVVDGSGTRHDCAAGPRRRLARRIAGIARVHDGLVYAAPSPVADAAEKRAIGARTGAVAVDMESAAVAGVAAAEGIAFLVLRAIVDPVHRSVPPLATRALDGPRTRPFRVAAGLLESPGQFGALLALAFAARRTRRTLAACADRLEPEFNSRS